MAVESILKVSIEDAAFTRYKKLFDDYNAELKKQPELWAKVSKSHRELSAQWARVATTFSNTLDDLEKANDALADQEKHLTLADRLWSGMEKSSRGFATNIIGVTTSLLKWSGLLTGVSGLLGYFSIAGMERLGGNVAGWRQSAMGQGTTIGQQRAFGLAFDRLLPGHTGEFLSGINAMVSNITAQTPLYSLGVNPNAPTADVAIATLRRLREIATSTPTNQLGIQESMYGLQNMGISVEDLGRLQRMSGAEFSRLLGTYSRESGALNISDRTGQSWQDFITSMERAKQHIESVFVNGLVGLSGPLSKLTNAFATLLGTVMKSPELKKWIDELATDIKGWAKAIESNDFQKKVKQFTQDIGQLADKLHPFLHPVDTAKAHPFVAANAAAGGLIGYALAGPMGSAVGTAGGAYLASSVPTKAHGLSLLGQGAHFGTDPMGVLGQAVSRWVYDGLAPYLTGTQQSVASYVGGFENNSAQTATDVMRELVDALKSLSGGIRITVTSAPGVNVNASVAAQGAQP